MIDFIEGLGKVKISVRWPSSSFAVRSSMNSTSSASSESMLQWVEMLFRSPWLIMLLARMCSVILSMRLVCSSEQGFSGPS